MSSKSGAFLQNREYPENIAGAVTEPQQIKHTLFYPPAALCSGNLFSISR